MAEVLASLKKIGGNGEQYTETVLWTNPSPTAQFAGQTVTLSDSIANYKYLKVKACYNGGYTNVAVSPLILVSEFMTIVPSTRRCTFNIGNSSAANSYYSRAVQYVSPTSISFTDDWALKSNNTANTDVIPLEILGINELKGGSGLKTPFVFVVRCPQSTSYGQSVMLAENYNQYTYMRTMSQAEVNSWWGRTDITVATSVTLSESSGTTTIQETTLTTSPVLISSLNFVDTNMIWAQVRGTACAIMLYD